MATGDTTVPFNASEPGPDRDIWRTRMTGSPPPQTNAGQRALVPATWNFVPPQQLGYGGDMGVLTWVRYPALFIPSGNPDDLPIDGR
jgi:hypothetical protein